jgi:hypothetical protein
MAAVLNQARVKARQTGGVSPIRLDPVARPLGDQRWRHHNAFVPERRQLALDAITARPRLITEPQLHPLLAELASQSPQRRGRVRDPAIFPHLAPQATFRDRHDDPVLIANAAAQGPKALPLPAAAESLLAREHLRYWLLW